MKPSKSAAPHHDHLVEFAAPTTIRRMLDAARGAAANPLLGSELGRLRLNGIIDDRQLASGNRYAEIVDWYDCVTGSTRRLWSRQETNERATASDDAVIRGLQANGGDLAALARTDEFARTIMNAKARHREVISILANIGPLVLRSVNMVVIEDRHIEVGHRQWLIVGLDALDNVFRKH